MSITKEEVMSVKSRGFLRNRGTDCFSGRVVSVAGVYTADALSAIAECAEKFGSGRVVFTSRLSAEIVGIPFDKIPAAEAFLLERGLKFGGTGAKVRPITACKGTTCVYGNIDTHALAKIIHDKFYVGMASVKLPHKFKIGVGGCPNSCMKPSLNDVGIEGARAFTFDADKCRGCKKCAVMEGCPSRAVSVVNGKAVVDAAKCTKCGVCIGAVIIEYVNGIFAPRLLCLRNQPACKIVIIKSGRILCTYADSSFIPVMFRSNKTDINRNKFRNALGNV